MTHPLQQTATSPTSLAAPLAEPENAISTAETQSTQRNHQNPEQYAVRETHKLFKIISKLIRIYFSSAFSASPR
jgi:hypothetical protein